ncbi:hypothetical protein NMY22_g2480 [Coprinellus aureogranulatus]|nr:hypothetical protein NMY22_g2480 [Coprinellus aureogranulatus]
MRVDPCHGREATNGAVNAVALMLFKGDGDNAGQETLHEVEDVIDRIAYFSDRVEDVAVKDHLPLDSPLGGEEGAGMDGQT